MKKFVYSFAGLVLAASAAHAQPTEEPTGDTAAPEAHAGHAEPAAPSTSAEPATPADAAADPIANAPAEPAGPAAPAAAPLAVANVTDAEVDSFAKATVKLQEIQADATIAADLKQAAMQAAVTESGLDPVKYNAIGKAVQADPALRAKVQTAMSRYAGPSPSDG
jgi:hypothetical protein